MGCHRLVDDINEEGNQKDILLNCSKKFFDQSQICLSGRGQKLKEIWFRP